MAHKAAAASMRSLKLYYIQLIDTCLKQETWDASKCTKPTGCKNNFKCVGALADQCWARQSVEPEVSMASNINRFPKTLAPVHVPQTCN